MKRHTQYGHDALHITEQKLGHSTFLRYAREIALTHQEKWDGSGYPQGLKGEEIPLSGRLMALADVYDALISKRVYKPPFSHEKAVEIIREGRGVHFDPELVDAFVNIESTFRNIALTFADHEEERELLARTPLVRAASSCRIETVLLVEDNEINLAIMQSQLSAMGFSVESAINGQEALQKYSSASMDLILTDIQMPVLDGYQLVREIRRLEQNSAKSTPVVAITASEFDLNDASARRAGFNGYMLKPLEADALTRVLAGLQCDSLASAPE